MQLYSYAVAQLYIYTFLHLYIYTFIHKHLWLTKKEPQFSGRWCFSRSHSADGSGTPGTGCFVKCLEAHSELGNPNLGIRTSQFELWLSRRLDISSSTVCIGSSRKEKGGWSGKLIVILQVMMPRCWFKEPCNSRPAKINWREQHFDIAKGTPVVVVVVVAGAVVAGAEGATYK